MKKQLLPPVGTKFTLEPLQPRLLDVPKAAFYLSVGRQSIRDWYADGIIQAVPVPGAALRKGGRIIASPRKRRMSKLLFDVRDLDALVERLKKGGN